MSNKVLSQQLNATIPLRPPTLPSNICILRESLFIFLHYFHISNPRYLKCACFCAKCNNNQFYLKLCFLKLVIPCSHITYFLTGDCLMFILYFVSNQKIFDVVETL